MHNLAREAAVTTPDEDADNAHDASATGSERTDRLAHLTPRQLQIVALLRDGLRAAQIAEELGIPPSTVYRQVERAKRRAGVSTRDALVALAVQSMIVSPPDADDARAPVPAGFIPKAAQIKPRDAET